MLPEGAVFVGGGSKARNLIDLAKSELRLPCTIGFPEDQEFVTGTSVSDPGFASAVGALLLSQRSGGFGRGTYVSSELDRWSQRIGKKVFQISPSINYSFFLFIFNFYFYATSKINTQIICSKEHGSLKGLFLKDAPAQPEEVNVSNMISPSREYQSRRLWWCWSEYYQSYD
jgi:hypothetical protein